MTSPHISVVVPTNRIGGLDLLLNSLQHQTFKNFELVLVDNIHKCRADLVAERSKAYDFPITHVPPGNNPFPRVAYCRTMNTGIVHSRGDVLVYLCDYCWLNYDCLEVHAEIQAKRPGPLLLDFAYTPLPDLAHGLPRFHQDDTLDGPQTVMHTEEPDRFVQSINAATDRYVEALDSGALDPYMWSIFAEPIVTRDQVWNLGISYPHYKNAEEGPFADYNYCCFKNESFPTALMLSMNGHDEEYDQSHGWQDSEFSYRLRQKSIGWWCGARARGEVRCVNPRGVLNIKRLEQVTLYNKALCDEVRVAERELPVNPGFSIAEMREAYVARCVP